MMFSNFMKTSHKVDVTFQKSSLKFCFSQYIDINAMHALNFIRYYFLIMYILLLHPTSFCEKLKYGLNKNTIFI